MTRDYREATGEEAGIRAYFETPEGRAALAAPRFHCGRCRGWSSTASCRFCGHVTRPDGKVAEPCAAAAAGNPSACDCAALYAVST